MKKLLLSLLVAAPLVMHADEAKNYVSSDAQQITYKVTIYRDDKYDQESWNKLVASASSAIKRGVESKDDDPTSTDAVARAFVQSIEEVYRRDTKGKDGIHGSMSIEVADASDGGAAESDCCKSECICTEKRAEMGSCDPECKAACSQNKCGCPAMAGE